MLLVENLLRTENLAVQGQEGGPLRKCQMREGRSTGRLIGHPVIDLCPQLHSGGQLRASRNDLLDLGQVALDFRRVLDPINVVILDLSIQNAPVKISLQLLEFLGKDPLSKGLVFRLRGGVLCSWCLENSCHYFLLPGRSLWGYVRGNKKSLFSFFHIPTIAFLTTMGKSKRQSNSTHYL